MKGWRLLLLGALLLPEPGLQPARADLMPSFAHWLGTDDLGRDGVMRLLVATARSAGLASAVALVALSVALAWAAFEPRLRPARTALRNVPPLLVLIPLLQATGPLPWTALVLVLAGLMALHLESPLVAALDPWLRGPAWHAERSLGASWPSSLRRWGPFLVRDGAGRLFPSAWLEALWAESALRLLGLGPGPDHDSLGLLLWEQLPRFASGATALGWAALGLVLALAWSLKPPTETAAP